jgi:serine/threonine-protein kinase
MHPHWRFPPPAKYTDPASPFYRFKRLPVGMRLQALDCIFAFHVHVEQQRYVAIDLYDGSLMYDFRSNTMKLCDIDYYRPMPYVNSMGRMWGSSRFMSPEEFELGAAIDGITNVFNMGAIAFCLLGGERDRDYAKWDAGEPLYEVARKAVSLSREQRHQSVADFYTSWSSCVKEFTG